MHSGVRSSIHLMTANKPSTKVERHKTMSVKVRNVQDVAKGTVSSTNDFLRKGGSLPPVLPVNERFCSDTCTQQQSKNTTVKRTGQENSSRQPPRRTASVVLHTKTMEDPICKEATSRTDTMVHHLKSCQLEKKVEHLSDKISRVQDIILSQMTADSNIKQGTTKNASTFSARDYTLLVLEMNGNVPTKPYDPNDFSENEKMSNSTDCAKRDSVVETKTSCGKSAKLLEIRNELNSWRAAQRKAQHK